MSVVIKQSNNQFKLMYFIDCKNPPFRQSTHMAKTRDQITRIWTNTRSTHSILYKVALLELPKNAHGAPVNSFPPDNFSKNNTKVIPNEECILLTHNL